MEGCNLKRTTSYFKPETLWVALSALSMALILVMMLGMGLLIFANSFAALWPNRIEAVTLRDGATVMGVFIASDTATDGTRRLQYNVANRDLNSGADFVWIDEKDIVEKSYPENAVVVGRMENGDFIGYFHGDTDLTALLSDYRKRWQAEGKPLLAELSRLGDTWQSANLQVLSRRYELAHAAQENTKTAKSLLHSAEQEEQRIKEQSEDILQRYTAVKNMFQEQKATFAAADGRTIELSLSDIVLATWPNGMTIAGKLWQFLVNTWNLLVQYPREANTEGGLFPAIFGTVVMVFIVAISAFPLGVAAGVYLREYAKDTILSRTARVAVNNLAAVPSIVYGIFGLGFFVYGLGGTIDQLLYPERVAAGITTFGGGGILWSSLTLGLLTLPVVIVATEEALATIPSEIRQGSLALGATRFQTLCRVVLPMASPGILTGFILAMARAAGEVAPLMLTGVVKSAHSLPLDSTWPFVHLERKFMHLGFHIYDMGFQSPNVEASKPLVYLTALVLLVLVFALNFTAIRLRKRLHEKYAMKGF